MPRNALLVTLLWTGAMSASWMANGEEAPQVLRIGVDASRTTGEIRPMMDMNCGPICLRGYFDFTAQYKELGVRFIRLHDVPFTFDNVVDMNYVYPNIDADPENEASYDFAQTDFYLKSIAAEGMQMIYRFGYSAEFEKSPLVHNAPPKSFENWASACAHIVRHYNHGWSNGTELGIRYWEVGNEPDIPGFWSGTAEEYCRLYELTARAVKAVDPAIKIGGPALALKMDFLETWLKHCRDHEVPIDFVSWHIYTWSAKEVLARAANVHELMDKYGFTGTESILDEWNYIPENYAQLDREGMFSEQAGVTGASFDAAVLIRLQDNRVSIAPFYTGTHLIYGLFNQRGTPHKAYYAFLAFRRMLDTPARLAVENPMQDDVPALAGMSPNRDTVRVLVANPEKKECTVDVSLTGLPWSGPTSCETHLLTKDANLESAGTRDLSAGDAVLNETLPATSVCLLTLTPKQP